MTEHRLEGRSAAPGMALGVLVQLHDGPVRRVTSGDPVAEARAYGADAILLIVACLDDTQLRTLYDLAHELGMEVLVEVHDDDELQRALALNFAIIGINNRNLHTFEISLDVTAQVAAKLPRDRMITLVSESGIFTAADVAIVGRNGAQAILVGEALITAPDMLAKTKELAGHD